MSASATLMPATVGPFDAAVSALLAQRPDAVVLVEGAGRVDGASAAFPGRVLSLPMADRAIAGVAVGLAIGGRSVLVDLADTDRLAALHEVIADAAALRAPVVWRCPPGRRPALDALVGIPGLRVIVAPSADAEAGWLLNLRGPAVLVVPAASGAADVGACASLREGGHLVLAAIGEGVAAALAAADRLAGEGIEATVLAVADLTDAEVGAALRRTGRMVVVVPPGEEALGRRLGRVGLDAAFYHLESPLTVAPAVVADVVAAARSAIHD